MLAAVAAALCLLALLLAPAAAARPLAEIRAQSVAIDGGSVSGPLHGAAWAAPQPFALLLAAGSATVTLERSDRPLVVGGAVVVPQEDRRDLDAEPVGSVLSAELLDAPDPSALALVLPSLGAAATAAFEAPAGLSPAGDPARFASRTAAGNPDHAFAPGGLHVDLAGGALEVRGSFRLVLTGLHVALATSEGSLDLDTRRVEQPVAGPAGAAALHVVASEAILDLTDAVLRMPVALAGLGTATFAGADAMTLHQADGSLSGGPWSGALAGDHVALAGTLAGQVLAVAGTGRLQASLSGTLRAVTLDGQALAPAAPAAPWPRVAGSAFGVLLVVAAAYVHLGRRRFARLDAAMDRAAHPEALALAGRFRPFPWLAEDADLARAICLLSLARPADALQALDGRPRWAVGRRATRDFLAARAEAACGRPDAAARRLASSIALDHAFLAEAQVDAVLAPVLRALAPGPGEAYA
jgi:hypothetical protein